MNMTDRMSIGQLAKAAGVNVETIRFYQRKGLLAAPPRPPGGIRRYHAADVTRLKFIKSAQRLGFSLDEVAELLRLDDGAHCAEVSELASARLADVRVRIASLVRMEAVLSGLVRRCHEQHGTVSCPLIAALHETA